MDKEADILGVVLHDFWKGSKTDELLICGEDLQDEIMDVSYYFRSYKEMPEVERIALDNCKGKVLDVGGGAGSHTLYLQQNGHDTTAIDISKGAVNVMKERGVLNARCIDINSLKGELYDSILLLMNGIGISGKLDSLAGFVEHLFSMLAPEGQVIFDSTDLRYLFMEEDGSFWIDLNANYYGELVYNYSYKNINGKSFPWLYVDEDTMLNVCSELNIKMEIIHRDDEFHYLARLYR